MGTITGVSWPSVERASESLVTTLYAMTSVTFTFVVPIEMLFKQASQLNRIELICILADATMSEILLSIFPIINRCSKNGKLTWVMFFTIVYNCCLSSSASFFSDVLDLVNKDTIKLDI